MACGHSKYNECRQASGPLSERRNVIARGVSCGRTIDCEIALTLILAVVIALSAKTKGRVPNRKQR